MQRVHKIKAVDKNGSIHYIEIRTNTLDAAKRQFNAMFKGELRILHVDSRYEK